MNCIGCGNELLEVVAMTVGLGGPQVCGPCIDAGTKFIRLNFTEEQIQRLVANMDDADFCSVCDCHPSSGHDRRCPLLPFGDHLLGSNP